MTNETKEPMSFVRDVRLSHEPDAPLGALARRRELALFNNINKEQTSGDIEELVESMTEECDSNPIVIRGFIVSSADVARILENRMESVKAHKGEIDSKGVTIDPRDLGQFAKRREEFILRRASHGKFNMHELFPDGSNATEEDMMGYQVAVDDLILRGFLTYEKLYFFITSIGKNYLHAMDEE